MTMADGYGSDIKLPGRAEQSIWGYDPLLECFWAQLWRDEDRTDRPRIWISTYYLIPTLDLLIRLVADAIDQPVGDVYVAMTASGQTPRLVTREPAGPTTSPTA